MIQANLIGVQQNFDFSSKKIRSFVVFDLGGKRIHAEVEDIKEVQALVEAGLDGAVVTSEPVAATTSEPVINWVSAPEEVVSSRMKQALGVLEVPHLLELDKLKELTKSISQEFTEEDWATVSMSDVASSVMQEEARDSVVVAPQTSPGFSSAQPSPSPPVRSQRPAVGEIFWHDGSPVLPGGGARARTVPADEYGYPIVSNAGVDPGEIVGGGDVQDEDGIGQF